jgi:hypothetical protein
MIALSKAEERELEKLRFDVGVTVDLLRRTKPVRVNKTRTRLRQRLKRQERRLDMLIDRWMAAKYGPL